MILFFLFSTIYHSQFLRHYSVLTKPFFFFWIFSHLSVPRACTHTHLNSHKTHKHTLTSSPLILSDECYAVQWDTDMSLTNLRRLTWLRDLLPRASEQKKGFGGYRSKESYLASFICLLSFSEPLSYTSESLISHVCRSNRVRCIVHFSSVIALQQALLTFTIHTSRLLHKWSLLTTKSWRPPLKKMTQTFHRTLAVLGNLLYVFFFSKIQGFFLIVLFLKLFMLILLLEYV